MASSVVLVRFRGSGVKSHMQHFPTTNVDKFCIGRRSTPCSVPELGENRKMKFLGTDEALVHTRRTECSHQKLHGENAPIQLFESVA